MWATQFPLKTQMLIKYFCFVQNESLLNVPNLWSQFQMKYLNWSGTQKATSLKMWVHWCVAPSKLPYLPVIICPWYSIYTCICAASSLSLGFVLVWRWNRWLLWLSWEATQGRSFIKEILQAFGLSRFYWKYLNVRRRAATCQSLSWEKKHERNKL